MPLTSFHHHLQQLAKSWAARRLVDLFQQDSLRIQNFQEKINGLCFDYSRNFIDETTVDALIAWANNIDLDNAMVTWQQKRKLNNNDVVWQQCHDFVQTCQNHHQSLTLIHLGTGGMYTPHRALAEALRAWRMPQIQLRFVPSPEAAALNHALAGLDAKQVQILIASTSFQTASTLAQARRARAWLQSQLPANTITQHLIAITSNVAAARAFGINPQRIFDLSNYLGGRFSTFTPAALPWLATIPNAVATDFWAGVKDADQHFFHQPKRHNIPFLMALISVWYSSFLNIGAHGVVPYSYDLRHFGAWLRQLVMESNGKPNVTGLHSAPLLWGAEGSLAEHSLWQWLHQASRLSSLDILLFAHLPQQATPQVQATMRQAIINAQKLMTGINTHDTHLNGNRPSSILLFDKLSPFNLGRLFAIYEHKTWVESQLWQINAFNQPAVDAIKHHAAVTLDATSQSLINHLEKYHHD